MPQPTASATERPSGHAATRPMTVITGGSQGIGLELARRFAHRGDDLLLVARQPARLTQAAADIQVRSAVTVATLSLDLTRDDALDVLDAELSRLGAHCEVLVNNAAVGYCGPVATMDPVELDRLIALNVAAPARLMRHVLPGMRERRSGGILNVASLGGYTPGPYQAAYYASKAWLISLSEAVAAEVQTEGVRVTVVAPGPVNTGFHAKMAAESALYRRLLPASSPASVARWAVLGYRLGLKVVVPGLHNLVAAVGLRILPHVILVPLMAILLFPRGRQGEGRSRDA